ncbi:hypothetical protein EC991_010596 [Linnemannia zychae]|nr:hypothetical protein EC991_010596 [Linnemannia zychae]
MRYSILLLAAAAFVAVQAAPIKNGPEAGSLDKRVELPCKKQPSGEWICPLTDDIEAQAESLNKRVELPCKKLPSGEWYCPLTDDVEAQAESLDKRVELPCKKLPSGEWLCPFANDAEALAGAVTPNSRVCRKVGQKYVCTGDK